MPRQDILAVPDFFLKETVHAVGRYLVEEPFYPLPGAPSPVLRGLDAAGLPLLSGLQRHDAQGHGPPGSGHAAGRPAAGHLAVRAGPRCRVDLGRQGAMGVRMARLGRLSPLCGAAGGLDAARSAG